MADFLAPMFGAVEATARGVYALRRRPVAFAVALTTGVGALYSGACAVNLLNRDSESSAMAQKQENKRDAVVSGLAAVACGSVFAALVRQGRRSLGPER